MKKKNLLSWILEFAGRKCLYFIGSIILAMSGVAASFAAYTVVARIANQLLIKNMEWNYYLKQTILLGVCWLIRVSLHTLSTSLSHIATFNVLVGYYLHTFYTI